MLNVISLLNTLSQWSIALGSVFAFSRELKIEDNKKPQQQQQHLVPICLFNGTDSAMKEIMKPTHHQHQIF